MIGGAVGAAAALAAPALAIASNEAPSIAELIEKHRADARDNPKLCCQAVSAKKKPGQSREEESGVDRSVLRR